MPLSEEEQKVLRDMERSFYESDPAFVKSVENTTLTKRATRNCVVGAVLLGLGLFVLVATFRSLPFVAFLGFVVMVSGTFVIVNNVRRLVIARTRHTPERHSN